MFLKCFGDSSSSGRQYSTVIEELCRHFSLADVKESTNNFNRIIRRGGCCRVYKGYLQHNDGSVYPVAVKRFNVECSAEFRKEVELLCQLHHPNCVSLIGFCNHEKEKIAVFEYMSNGTLDEHLRGMHMEALSWKKRVEICVGAARGLHYLHSGVKRTIIHRDIHPANIVLDDNMQPKLSRFGLSIQGAHFTKKPKPIQTTFVVGYSGYIAPECFRDRIVTDKCDVYAFGVVLLRVVSGSRIFELDKFGHFRIAKELLEKPVEENIDPNIKGKIAPECWQVFIDITLRCIKSEPDERPTMGEVEVELEHALLLQEQAHVTNIDSDYTLLSETLIDIKSEGDLSMIIHRRE